MNPTQLRRKVLEKLQVLASGEPVDSDDGQLVQAAYESLHAILIADDLVTWVVSEDIPDEFEWPMIAMVAAELVDEFHCPDGLKVKILLEGKYNAAPTSFAERQLRRLTSPGYDGEPAETEYF
jgi:hypothetical protein